MSTNEARAAVEAVWRSESARIVGALARYTGDFPLAEDLAQEALAEALVSWSVNGAPAEPVGWLLTAGRRRAIDAFRRRAALNDKYALLARDLTEEEAGVDTLFNPQAIDDDVLALMFISCHPVVSREARIAMTLRVVGGMTTEEIAKAFLVPVPTIQARITGPRRLSPQPTSLLRCPKPTRFLSGSVRY
jgi:predicted RNA polymerase sigma factor